MRKKPLAGQSLSLVGASIVCYITAWAQSPSSPSVTATTLTRVTVQLRVNHVDRPVFLRFFGRLRRPGAGHQVIGAPVLLQANKVEGDGAELSRPAPLQEHHLVVVWDLSVETRQRSISGKEIKSEFIPFKKNEPVSSCYRC